MPKVPRVPRVRGAVLGVLAVLGIRAVLGAQGQRAPGPRELVGTWTLSAVERTGGGAPAPLPLPRGLLVFDAAGHAFELASVGPRVPSAGRGATPAEAHAIYNNYSGFWGSYTVGDQKITYRPEGAVSPERDGPGHRPLVRAQGRPPHHRVGDRRGRRAGPDAMDVGPRPAAREPDIGEPPAPRLLASRRRAPHQRDDRRRASTKRPARRASSSTRRPDMSASTFRRSTGRSSPRRCRPTTKRRPRSEGSSATTARTRCIRASCFTIA